MADGEDISTPQLISLLAKTMNKPAHLFPVPVGLLKFGAILMNREALFQQLCGSLQVDISKARKLLEWDPPVSIENGLQQTCDDYMQRQQARKI